MNDVPRFYKGQVVLLQPMREEQPLAKPMPVEVVALKIRARGRTDLVLRTLTDAEFERQLSRIEAAQKARTP